MSDLFTRIQVLARSALTWLTAISAVLVAASQQLEGVAGIPEWLTRGLASVIAVIGVVILQVRRVTPVPDDQKGLLPPKGPAVAVAGDVDRGVGPWDILAFIVVAFIVVFVITRLFGRA